MAAVQIRIIWVFYCLTYIRASNGDTIVTLQPSILSHPIVYIYICIYIYISRRNFRDLPRLSPLRRHAVPLRPPRRLPRRRRRGRDSRLAAAAQLAARLRGAAQQDDDRRSVDRSKRDLNREEEYNKEATGRQAGDGGAVVPQLAVVALSTGECCACVFTQRRRSSLSSQSDCGCIA